MLEPPGFWTENSNIGYENISLCIENQYWQFSASQLPENSHVNGTRTLNENLADIGGVRMAYYGYCKLVFLFKNKFPRTIAITLYVLH